jgi:DNA-binding transcriptional LysR family regulator
MRREELVDLNAFATVADEQSFTRAAAKLGTSQSALSHTINRLEARVGVRLLTRTTRNVAPTEAGERMLRALGFALGNIAEALASLRELREKPAGTIRITTSEHAAHAVLWPALKGLADRHRQRIALRPAQLRPRDVNRLGHPVHVVQGQSLDFATSQAIMDQQRQNRMITDVDGVIAESLHPAIS